MSAVISECGNFRWVLRRAVRRSRLVRRSGYVLWVMLNPSTADASLDDPTIRRIKDFSGQWGFSEAVVVNLYAFRATSPADMLKAEDPVGPLNDQWVFQAALHAEMVVCGWGKHGAPERVAAITEILLASNQAVYCLGTNGDGSPKHPLYLARTTPPQIWRAQE